jgi:predicted acyltransferase
MKTSARLESLDALRGFDMMFIMGFATLAMCLCALWPGNAVSNAITTSMEHADWNGLRHHDTIFPLFLFIAGCAFPFSMAAQQEKGASHMEIFWRTIRRGLTLFLLGMVYNGLFDLKWSTVRIWSVLGRIGLAWMFAAILYTYCNRKVRIGIAAFILTGYSLLLCLVVAPDAPAGASPLSYEGNLVGYIDRCLFPNHLHQDKFFDPEGLLSTLPAIVTAMLGMFTGELLRSSKYSGNRKTLYMLIAAAVLIGIGLAWSNVMPINKKLWSSSFVCVVAGYSVAMMALFYWIIDVKGWRTWATWFRVIGLNSITIYMLQRIVKVGDVTYFFVGGLEGLFPKPWPSIIQYAGLLAVNWLILYFLYRKKVFLKI